LLPRTCLCRLLLLQRPFPSAYPSPAGAAAARADWFLAAAVCKLHPLHPRSVHALPLSADLLWELRGGRSGLLTNPPQPDDAPAATGNRKRGPQDSALSQSEPSKRASIESIESERSKASLKWAQRKSQPKACGGMRTLKSEHSDANSENTGYIYGNSLVTAMPASLASNVVSFAAGWPQMR
jgi:hypothetical protein